MRKLTLVLGLLVVLVAVASVVPVISGHTQEHCWGKRIDYVPYKPPKAVEIRLKFQNHSDTGVHGYVNVLQANCDGNRVPHPDAASITMVAQIEYWRYSSTGTPIGWEGCSWSARTVTLTSTNKWHPHSLYIGEGDCPGNSTKRLSAQVIVFNKSGGLLIDEQTWGRNRRHGIISDEHRQF